MKWAVLVGILFASVTMAVEIAASGMFGTRDAARASWLIGVIAGGILTAFVIREVAP